MPELREQEREENDFSVFQPGHVPGKLHSQGRVKALMAGGSPDAYSRL